MSYIGKIFQAAVSLIREDQSLKKIWNRKSLPPIYVDCGNTLFFKTKAEVTSETTEAERKKYIITTNDPLLNFLIALKEAGYRVQLMSHEPLRYLDILHDELLRRGKSTIFFEDGHTLSIMRKEIIDKSMHALILIDNDPFSVPVQTKSRLFLNDKAFLEELEGFRNFETAVLPEPLKPSVLWAA